MKHRALVPFVVLAFLLTGCTSSPGTPTSEGSGAGSTASAPSEEQAPPAQPLDLTGDWKQTNRNSANSYQVATIGSGIITVNWVTDDNSTTVLHWVGTYEAPTEAAHTFT